APGQDDSRPDDPVADFSVLDADSSQRNAIDSVVAGRSLVIHGPPGTGKSQTIANLIAAMVARGRKVLFVAEKRAAIDGVLSPRAARVPARLPDPEQITPELAEAIRDELREFTRLGGFTLHPGSTPWFGA